MNLRKKINDITMVRDFIENSSTEVSNWGAAAEFNFPNSLSITNLNKENQKKLEMQEYVKLAFNYSNNQQKIIDSESYNYNLAENWQSNILDHNNEFLNDTDEEDDEDLVREDDFETELNLYEDPIDAVRWGDDDEYFERFFDEKQTNTNVWLNTALGADFYAEATQNSTQIETKKQNWGETTTKLWEFGDKWKDFKKNNEKNSLEYSKLQKIKNSVENQASLPIRFYPLYNYSHKLAKFIPSFQLWLKTKNSKIGQNSNWFQEKLNNREYDLRRDDYATNYIEGSAYVKKELYNFLKKKEQNSEIIEKYTNPIEERLITVKKNAYSSLVKNQKKNKQLISNLEIIKPLYHLDYTVNFVDDSRLDSIDPYNLSYDYDDRIFGTKYFESVDDANYLETPFDEEDDMENVDDDIIDVEDDEQDWWEDETHRAILSSAMSPEIIITPDVEEEKNLIYESDREDVIPLDLLVRLDNTEDWESEGSNWTNDSLLLEITRDAWGEDMEKPIEYVEYDLKIQSDQKSNSKKQARKQLDWVLEKEAHVEGLKKNKKFTKVHPKRNFKNEDIYKGWAAFALGDENDVVDNTKSVYSPRNDILQSWASDAATTIGKYDPRGQISWESKLDTAEFENEKDDEILTYLEAEIDMSEGGWEDVSEDWGRESDINISYFDENMDTDLEFLMNHI